MPRQTLDAEQAITTVRSWPQAFPFAAMVGTALAWVSLSTVTGGATRLSGNVGCVVRVRTSSASGRFQLRLSLSQSQLSRDYASNTTPTRWLSGKRQAAE